MHPCYTAGVADENKTKGDFFFLLQGKKEKEKLLKTGMVNLLQRCILTELNIRQWCLRPNHTELHKKASVNDFTQIIERVLHFLLFLFSF